MKVALYARVAAQCQEKKGPMASQIEALRTHAREQRYEIAEDYLCCDNGVSGTLLARPQFDRLRRGARAGVFDAVLVRSPDRLSRNCAHLFVILEEFERLGTPVLFLEQPLLDDPNAVFLVRGASVIHE